MLGPVGYSNAISTTSGPKTLDGLVSVSNFSSGAKNRKFRNSELNGVNLNEFYFSSIIKLYSLYKDPF